MHQNRYFYFPLFSFIFGIIFAFKLGVYLNVFLFLILGHTILLLFFREKGIFITVCFLILLLAFIRVSFVQNETKLNYEYLELEGKVADAPDNRENYSIYKVQYKDENIRVYLNRHHQYEYGDVLKIKGELVEPENFSNEYGIEFDYVNFLSKDDVYSQMFYPRVEFIKKEKSFLGYVFSFKKFLVNKINLSLPSPYAELSNGLLLGEKSSMGKEWLEKFRVVGLIHIIVLSGYNITIIADSVRRVLFFFPKILSSVVSIIFIILFVIMVGAHPAIIRAGVMSILLIIAESSKGNYEINRSLFFAGALMVLFNPEILLYDPGFQLSFVATLGLVHVSPLLEKFLMFIPKISREILSTTLATQIAVTPMLISMMGEISVISLLANILVLPIVPLTMLLSFLIIVFSGLSLSIKALLIFPTYLLLKYQFLIVDFLSSLPFATLKIFF